MSLLLFLLSPSTRFPAPSKSSPTGTPSSNPHHHRSRLKTSKAFSEEEISLFARLCGDGNPLHQRRRRRKQSSLSSSPTSSLPSSPPSSSAAVLVPGLLTASLFPGLIGTAIPGSVYLTQSLQFSAPLRAGEEVEVEVSVVSKKVLPLSRVLSSSSSYSSSSSSARGGKKSSAGLMLQLLQQVQQEQSEQGGGGGSEETVAATKEEEEEEGKKALPTSFVRAKLETRAWRGDSSIVVVEGEAEALWPVY